MGFTITTRDATAGDRRGTVYLLADDAGTCRAEVWPVLGFNCLRWQVRTADGTWGDLLYAAPDWETNPVPTRSGHPVLFPFPNRLRDGGFTFAGKSYQLPLNESTGKHAIHGFTPRNPWRVVGTNVGADSASITGQFTLSKDLPSARGNWPADFSLTLTYRLTRMNGSGLVGWAKSSRPTGRAMVGLEDSAHPTNYQLTPNVLSVEAVVECPDAEALPFGLGYHPYFCLPTAPGAPADEMVLEAPVNQVWIADGGIPTGEQKPVPLALDFRTPRAIGTTVLDTLYTVSKPLPGQDLSTVARLGHRSATGQLTVAVSPAFQDLLLFTPPHRRAVAIESYTCASDAPNLAARGIDSGWQILPPGGRWAAVVEYRWNPDARPML
ncbi:MAG TPA: aldose 1-epimerase [Fimbriiglobus sp.]|nr:aldose 1-epimerase [Fimbriiglobus sp.]